MFQKITFEDGTEWGVTVAESRGELISERRAAQDNLLPVFGLVGLIGVAGSLMLMSAIGGPLRKLRADVTHRWDKGDDLRPEDYPEEVSPLVDDLNQLLHRNREIVSGSRRQAADLAHALKTPTAILRNELTALSDNGADTQPADDALNRSMLSSSVPLQACVRQTPLNLHTLELILLIRLIGYPDCSRSRQSVKENL
ncbi:hypothetical protein [Ruegeria atlantica]|uniref:hypothetical protein n=1 Tax=Ruegeria atlantica TaxID=81569 RepID=UPI00071C96F0|nr:hypothetical protein [Ruegeria atlantica]